MYKINTNLVRRYAQKYAEMNMSATVRIDRPAAPSLDPNTGDVSAVMASTIYEGKARITSTSGPNVYQYGEEQQYFSGASVSIPLVDEQDVPVTPQINDMVVVLGHHDVLMIGRQFRVIDVEASGQFEAVRRLSVTGAQRWESWTPDSNIPPEWYV